MNEASRAVGIGIVGLGTVGGGVVRLIQKHHDDYVKAYGADLRIVRACALERSRADELGIDADAFTTDWRDVVGDPDVDIVIELIGGEHPATEIFESAFAAGKHVVSANKALLGRHVEALGAKAAAAGVQIRCEAAAGGGIPIVGTLEHDLVGNQILTIAGIMNGTTNYILTRMVRTGAFFSDALREAQAKGYAEADPTADVEGIDAGRKICILADLAFGHQVDPADVPMEGISKLSLRDVKVAQRAGYRVKLLGRAVRLPGGGRTAYVAPHLIPEDNPISGVEDVFNAVMVQGNATGEVMFYGKGAGEMPTASACVADVMECLQASPRREEIGWSADQSGFEDPAELRTRYYFRIEGSLTDAAMAFGQVEVLSEDGETAFLTESISGRDAQRQSRSLNVLACMRVLD